MEPMIIQDNTMFFEEARRRCVENRCERRDGHGPIAHMSGLPNSAPIRRSSIHGPMYQACVNVTVSLQLAVLFLVDPGDIPSSSPREVMTPTRSARSTSFFACLDDLLDYRAHVFNEGLVVVDKALPHLMAAPKLDEGCLGNPCKAYLGGRERGYAAP